MQIEQKVPDKIAPIVAVLRRRHALGARGEDAARSSATRTSRAPTPASSAGRTSATRWRRRPSSPTRSAIATRATCSCPRSARWARRSCSRRRCCLLGAGGLGSPAALYLAAAGVGTLGLVDADVVDASNLQRQILHATSRVGDAEGRERREGDRRISNPDVKVVKFQERLDSDNVERIFARLRRHRRRLRQLPDALPRQRRVRVHEEARSSTARSSASTARSRRSSPLHRRALLPLPLSGAAAAAPRAELPGGRRARHPAAASSACFRRPKRSS